MNETPNLGLPYPELTDTADVPRDIKALADTLDTLLGGGGGGGGGGVLPLSAAPVLAVGMAGQIRAGRQLTVADFTSLGLSPPIGLWNLSDLTNLGSDGRALVNLGAVPFDTGINGLGTTAARFSGSTGQALYTDDSGAADPFRIKTGSWGCWFRTAKRGTTQELFSKRGGAAGLMTRVNASNVIEVFVSADGSTWLLGPVVGLTDVADDRWHFASVTFDGTALRIYVDATLETVANGSGALTFPGPLNIGAFGANASTAATNPCFGRVDEAFITGDVLTEDQIRLLYAARLSHALGAIPSAARVNVHRRRKGIAFAVADFPAQPIRLHNFTGGALTDQGSGGVALTNNGAAVAVGGADGTPGSAYHFAGAQSLSATDAGLPGGLTARSYGCWFKTASYAATSGLIGWGTYGSGDARMGVIGGSGNLTLVSVADVITGPFIGDGQWHFAVGVEDNTATDGVKRKLYLDGRLVGASTVLNAVTLAGANRFRVATTPDGLNPFTGQVDGAFVSGAALTIDQIAALYAKGTEDLGRSPKNAGDHVERLDATSVLFIGDTLESQWTVDLGVVA